VCKGGGGRRNGRGGTEIAERGTSAPTMNRMMIEDHFSKNAERRHPTKKKKTPGGGKLPLTERSREARRSMEGKAGRRKKNAARDKEEGTRQKKRKNGGTFGRGFREKKLPMVVTRKTLPKRKGREDLLQEKRGNRKK